MADIKHPDSDHRIQGRLVQVGEVLEAGDHYDSTTGKWEPLAAAFLGKPLENNGTVVVRPDKAA